MSEQKSVDQMKTFNEALRAEIKETDELMMPLLKEYLNNIREVRMAIAREVRDIIQSTREMNQMTKHTDDIIKFIDALMLLEKILTPSMMDKINRIAGKQGNE